MNTIFKTGRRVMGIAILGLIGFNGAGCGTVAPPPPANAYELSVVTVTPIENVVSPGGTSPGQDQSELYRPLIEEQFRAQGSGQYPPSTNTEVQRMSIGKVRARRIALRQLASSIRDFRPEGRTGATVGALLDQSPDKQAQLNDVLETQSEVAFSELPNEVVATASISGEEIAYGIGLISKLPSAADALDQAERENRQREKEEEARQAAIERGRERMREEILRLPTARGTIDQLRAQDESLAAAIEHEVLNLQPASVHVREDGMVEVEMKIDRRIILRAAGEME